MKTVQGFLPLLAAASLCLGSGPGGGQGARPYFGDGFEKAQVLARGYGQRYHEGILVTGTEGYIEGVRAALEALERADGRNWYFVRKHVRRITQTGHTGMDVGGGRFTSGGADVGEAEGLAGRIVHDAWHRELYQRGLPWRGREAEAFCIERQNEALRLLGAGEVPAEETLRSEYWKVDYWAREW